MIENSMVPPKTVPTKKDAALVAPAKPLTKKVTITTALTTTMKEEEETAAASSGSETMGVDGLPLAGRQPEGIALASHG